MNAEEARVKTSGSRGHGDDERGVKPARDRDLPRRSVEILRDLGLSKEKIVVYHRRFPTPTSTTGRGLPPGWGDRENAVSKESFDPLLHSSPLSAPC
jgi:hypothetical protein